MNILIASGGKTENIVGPLRQRFESGAVQVNGVGSIDDIIAQIQKGEIFDRAIIVEPAIMGEFGSDDWDYARDTIIRLLNNLGTEKDTAQFIFVVTNSTLADIIKEEMYNLGDYRVKVILNDSKFKLKFFIQLCTLELSQIENTYTSIKAADTVTDTVAVDSREGAQDVHENEVVTPEGDFKQEYAPDTDENEEYNSEADDKFSEAAQEFGEYPEGEIGEFGDMSGFNDVPEEFSSEVPEIDVAGDVNAFGEQYQIEGEPDSYGGVGINDNSEEFGGPSTGEYVDPENGVQEYSGLAKRPGEVTVQKQEEAPETIEEVPHENQYNQVNEDVAIEHPYTNEENTDENNTETADGVDGNGIPVAVPGFGDDLYDNQEQSTEDNVAEIPVAPATDTGEVPADDIIQQHSNQGGMQALKSILNTLGNRRTSICFTGDHGAGKTTVAYNTAVLIAKMGYQVLYVDMDTETRGASYMDMRVYKLVHTDDNTVSSLAHAIGNSSRINEHVIVAMPGLHMLTLGLDQELTPISGVGSMSRDKIHKFSSIVKQQYNFVIYDIPFEQLVNIGVDIVYSADKLVYITESNTRGFVDLMLDIANIEDDDLRQLVMTKTNVVLNKHYDKTLMFGKKAKSAKKVLEELDTIIYEVVGDDVYDRFSTMSVIGTIPLNPAIDSHWFTKKNFVETADGLSCIGGLLKAVLEA